MHTTIPLSPSLATQAWRLLQDLATRLARLARPVR